jgi:hypothetical protein
MVEEAPGTVHFLMAVDIVLAYKAPTTAANPLTYTQTPLGSVMPCSLALRHLRSKTMRCGLSHDFSASMSRAAAAVRTQLCREGFVVHEFVNKSISRDI